MKLITEASSEKLRGGFYTPEKIANFILSWGFNENENIDVLEPSCGDGVFLKGILKKNYKYNSITAVEIEKEEAQKAKKIPLNSNVLNEDFHHFYNTTDRKFDLIVGNPPYIRYQFFDREQQQQAIKIFVKAGLKYSKLTNAWVSFVVGASLLLKKEGKIGFVLPAEILQVSFAQQLRCFLAQFYNKIVIISFEQLVFPKIQQEVVLLLCEKNQSEDHNIDHIEIKDIDELQKLDVKKLKTPQKRIDFKSNKWTFYFLNQEEIDFLENISKRKEIPTLGTYANVEVGITTGSNDYFTIPLDVVDKYNLYEYAKPMVGRSVQVNSIIFNGKDWESNRDANAKAHLLVFPNNEVKRNKSVFEYIKYGEEKGINKGYKTGIRDNWYVIPSIKKSDALFIRRNNLYPRLIVNEAQAYTTDTMHRVYIKSGTNLNAFVASYYNSLTLAFSEVCGRSHGGGGLELMPNETERILLPYNNQNDCLINEIDSLMRKQTPIEQILSITNQIILKKHYGLTDEEINIAHNIWLKLSKRRLNRGKKKNI